MALVTAPGRRSIQVLSEFVCSPSLPFQYQAVVSNRELEEPILAPWRGEVADDLLTCLLFCLYGNLLDSAMRVP